jgi:ribonuclease HI
MTINENKSLKFVDETLSNSEWTIFFDGASNNSENIDASGIGVTIFNNGRIVKFIYEMLPRTGQRIQTNNESEYSALIKSLEYCIDRNLQDIIIYGDSKLVINQVNGLWMCRKSHLIPLHSEAVRLAMSLKENTNVSIKHIRREFNYFADMCSKISIDAISDKTFEKFRITYPDGFL